MTRLRIGLIAGLVALFAAGPALACRCVTYASPRAQLGAADVAFSGRVLSTGPTSPYEHTTTFAVEETLKGRVGRTAVVRHSPDVCCVCGVDFTRGVRVVVLADRQNGGLSTSSCQRGRWTDAELRAAAAPRRR